MLPLMPFRSFLLSLLKLSLGAESIGWLRGDAIAISADFTKKNGSTETVLPAKFEPFGRFLLRNGPDYLRRAPSHLQSAPQLSDLPFRNQQERLQRRIPTVFYSPNRKG